MTILDKLLLFTFYWFAAAAFTSNAALSAYLILMIVLSLFFVGIGINQKTLRFTASQVCLMGFGFATILSLIVNSKSTHIAHEESSAIARVFISALIALSVMRFASFKGFGIHVARLLLILAICSSLAHLSGIIGLYYGYNPLKFEPAVDPTRAAGLFGMAMTYGYGTQFLLLFWLALIIEYKNVTAAIHTSIISRKLLVGVAALTMLGFALSLTRGAYLGFAFALPLLFMKTSPRLFKLALGVFVALLIFATTIMFSVSPGNRLSFRSESNKIRISQYQAAWYALKEKPIFGHGFRQFSGEVGRIKQEHDISYKNFLGNAHNNIVEAFVTTGLIGGIFYLAFLAFWLRELIKMQHFLRPFFLATWMAFLVSGLFQTTLTDAENVYVIFLIYGVSVAIKLLGKSRDHESPAV